MEDITIMSLKDRETHKRAAEMSPEGGGRKRVFSDLTNCFQNNKVIAPGKKNIKGTKVDIKKANTKTKPAAKEAALKSDSSIHSSQEIDSSDLYITATEDFENQSESQKSPLKLNVSSKVEKQLPKGVTDFDAACSGDIYSEYRYVAEVFDYYKEREVLFVIEKYLPHQPEINKGMRAILVDWLVEVQESFELNHETLYLAVKLVDTFLAHNFNVPKSQLQLIGATAMLVASKYDERQPPLVDDFLYICDDSYTRKQLLQMEIELLKAVDFDLGIPLSYRFLRRYARTAHLSMCDLTLARYILETSLMDYDLIDILGSKLAAAALWLSLKMKKASWTKTLEYYSGYKETELLQVAKHLNKCISAPPTKQLRTIRTKYSHSIFHEVAKIPLIILN